MSKINLEVVLPENETDAPTPSITFTDDKGTVTSLPAFNSMQMKWSGSGRGKGLKFSIKASTPMAEDGTIKIKLRSFEIPADLESLIKLSDLLTKMAPNTVKPTIPTDERDPEEESTESVELENIQEAVV